MLLGHEPKIIGLGTADRQAGTGFLKVNVLKKTAYSCIFAKLQK
jgi:hypothetical protein